MDIQNGLLLAKVSKMCLFFHVNFLYPFKMLYFESVLFPYLHNSLWMIQCDPYLYLEIVAFQTPRNSC